MIPYSHACKDTCTERTSQLRQWMLVFQLLTEVQFCWGAETSRSAKVQCVMQDMQALPIWCCYRAWLLLCAQAVCVGITEQQSQTLVCTFCSVWIYFMLVRQVRYSC